MMQDMAQYFFMQWYEEDVSPNLTLKQKMSIMHRISELTLREPIWQDKEKNWIEEFPELKPFSNDQRLTGLQLCTVMKGMLKDLQNGSKRKTKN